MGDSFDYSASKLEQCTYRYLQQLAKSMCLPSNVKKVYLVEMINAKKCASEMEVQRIVQRVKRERQQLRYIKKRNRETLIQADTSSSESTSPPISLTPKRTPFMLQCSDFRQQIVRSQNSLLRSTATKLVPSDRVLRSCNLKTVKRPYMNKYLEVHQTDHIELVDQSTQMTPMRVIKKYKPNILGSSQLSNDRQMAPVTQIGRQIVVRRSRTVSAAAGAGAALVRVRGVRVRDGAGHLAALPAFVRQPRATPATPASSSAPRSSLTLQDIINGNVEAHTARLSCRTSTSTGIREVQTPEYTEITPESSSSVYYHKKIRAEQVRERRMSSFNTSRCPLPRISEAFGQFRAQRRDVTQPLYVHVGGESAYSTTGAGSCLLETVYNFKRQFLPAAPQAAAAATRCVYSAHTVATAAPHRPAASAYSDPYMASYERDNQYYGDPDNTRGDDYLRFGDEYDFRYHEDQNTSGSSMCTVQSQELGANVTISDMVEDALELISQDGDYLERMGMDVRMQCVLCNWAGPKIILEYHIRKEHAHEIDKQEKREWNISYTLGSVVSYPLWQSRVVEHACSLYVLSVKYEPPGYFMATLASLSSETEVTGSITMFNKVTGEPFSWTGPVRSPLDTPGTPGTFGTPDTLGTPPTGLRVQLAALDLLPNSANLQFVDGQLVLKSPTKVVFGPLELDDIHIILFVKISD